MSRKPKAKSKTQYKYIPKSQKSSSLVPKIILLIIILVAIAVVVAFLVSIFTSAEDSVKAKISSLTEEYYENYLYEGVINADGMSDQTTFEKTMQKYEEKGFGTVHLRQIFNYDNQKNSSYHDYITTYCDENKTYMKIYPEPPYERKSYHIDYHYSCNF